MRVAYRCSPFCAITTSFAKLPQEKSDTADTSKPPDLTSQLCIRLNACLYLVAAQSAREVASIANVPNASQFKISTQVRLAAQPIIAVPNARHQTPNQIARFFRAHLVSTIDG